MLDFHHGKLSRITLCTLFFLTLIGLVSLTQSSSQAAELPVWFDPELHEQDRIEVKLYNGLPLRAENGRLTPTTNDSKQQGKLAALATLPDGEWTPIFDLPEATLNKWQITATDENGEQLPELALYFYVQLPTGTNPAQAIADFRRHSLVEGAYPVAKPVAPPFPPDFETSNDSNFNNDLNMNIYQRYLDSAPSGMDVRYAWLGTGGRGDGIDICDVEYGWKNHSDLPNIPFLLPPVQTYPGNYYDHGTAVLGLLGAKDNGWGITGMVSEANLFFAPIHPITGSFNVADAITRCMNQLNAGDVILIEQQTTGQDGNFVPVEWIPSVYAAIKTAVANGIIVVEAAGNGSENLDDSFYKTAKPGHTPFTADKDSGAIIVGAANSPWRANPRTRSDSSTYGSTVDLHAWGMHLIAPGYGNYYNDEGSLLSYTLFGGTSGASPMITAAAAIAQANYIAKNGSPATPAQIKQLLRANGTPQEEVSGENIGPMPNLRATINDIWNITEPTTPTITPNSGAYSPPLQVSIDYGSPTQNSTNTHIRYTLDGSEPTVDSYIYIPEQGHNIQLQYGATVRAKAFSSNALAGRLFESETATAIFSLVAPKAAAPIISPNGGIYSQGQLLTMNSATPGATIKYRTDGRAPSFFYPGTTYNGPINLSPGTYNLVARAYKDGYYKSDATYAEQLVINPLTLPSPTIYPNGGSYTNEVTVYIGSTVLGAQIRYTTNGAEPTQYSTRYVDPITLTSDTTIKARVFLDGYTPSATASATFDVLASIPSPSIAPTSGTTANDSLTVYLDSTILDADIRYTTNGAEPTSYSTLYTAPLNLGPGQHTIKARAFYGGMQSSTSTATYTVYNTAVSVDPPEIYPYGGNFNGPITVTLTTDTENAFLFYTLDASDPASSGTVQPYNGPFTLNAGTYYVRARAYKSGIGNSSMSSATIVVVDPVNGTVQTPEISPPSGQYTNTVNVSVNAPDYSAPFITRRLYVTTDGTDPVADFLSPGDGVSGNYNFNLSKPTIVKALSAQAAWVDSEIASAEYTFICDTPTIATAGTYTDSTTVSISTLTSNATIYYTTDGSEPTTADEEYSSSFSISSSQVVKAICVRNNFEQSETAVSVFIINETPVAPAINTQPQNQTADSCTNATFAVSATGSDPLSYTWYKDGNIIGGATEPELTLAAVTTADAGNYSVVVKNDAGEVTSNTAVLTVNGSETSCVTNFPVYLPMIIK